MAQYFVSTRHCRETNAPCGNCHSCSRNLEKNQIDLFHCQSDKRISVEQVREISEWIQYGPVQYSTLFVIIHNSESMTTEAANSFLKTLEEPPANVCFLLLSHNIHLLLETIQSRCQSIDIPPSSPPQLKRFLSETTEELPAELDKYSSSRAVLDYYLRKKEIPEHPLISIKDLPTLSVTSQIQFTQVLSKNKDWVSLQYLFWLEEINRHAKEATTDFIGKGDLIVEKLKQLKYNLNVRLQLEDLLNQLV
jgi:DNA polymerase III delta prime subunit